MFLGAQDSSWPQARNAGLAQENPQQFIRTLGTIKNELPIISRNQDDVAPKSRSWRGNIMPVTNDIFVRFYHCCCCYITSESYHISLEPRVLKQQCYFLSGRMKYPICHTGRGLSEDAWSQMQ